MIGELGSGGGWDWGLGGAADGGGGGVVDAATGLLSRRKDVVDRNRGVCGILDGSIWLRAAVRRQFRQIMIAGLWIAFRGRKVGASKVWISGENVYPRNRDRDRVHVTLRIRTTRLPDLVRKTWLTRWHAAVI